MISESIIKHGSFFGKYIAFRCPLCGCEFTKSATNTWDLRVYPRTIGGFEFEVNCPECGLDFTQSVSKDDLSD